ncbi:MAG: multiprotein bridging factor aMBF1 [Candidatus Micrarchaeota archaeon]|nr:multiprotein bridging factor aMBF1 [Candidatus Micrarchaeota archaeon]
MDVFCDICGRGEPAAMVLIEGARLAACRSCAGHGKLLHRIESKLMPTQEKQEKPMPRSIGEDEIVEDYAARVKSKREQIGLPLAVIAEKINEKESYLDHIETGKLMPTIAVARKLEKELGIKLIEKVYTEVSSSIAKSIASRDATLGEFIVQKKK